MAHWLSASGIVDTEELDFILDLGDGREAEFAELRGASALPYDTLLHSPPRAHPPPPFAYLEVDYPDSLTCRPHRPPRVPSPPAPGSPEPAYVAVNSIPPNPLSDVRSLPLPQSAVVNQRISFICHTMSLTQEHQQFETGHLDRVTVLDHNFDSTRLLTGSIDHRVKIWDRNLESGHPTLVETFTAHGADVRDAKWFHPSSGEHLVTIGNDLNMRIWSEDPTQPPNSGRRFKRVCEIQSTTRVPFVSLDTKNDDDVYNYIAVIDRQGLLTIYEPTNLDDFREWRPVDQFNVQVPVPGRGEETSFKVRWDRNALPLPYVESLIDDQAMLSLVVSAGSEVVVYSTIPADKDNDDDSRPLTFYQVARLPTHPAMIRDVQWCPFNVRGFDWIATACKDGSVRVHELSAVAASRGDASAADGNTQTQAQTARAQPQSSLTTAIVGRRGGNNQEQPHTPPVAAPAGSTRRPKYPFPFKYNVTEVMKEEDAHIDVWSIEWDPTGMVLMSCGADGILKFWQKGIEGGEWLLVADQVATEDEAENGDSED